MGISRKSMIVAMAACGLFTGVGLSADPASSWPQFRGPTGTGQAADKAVPTKWDAGSVVWKTPLKGKGHSSPVVAGDKIFLTSALEDGRQRVVLAFDLASGKQLWEQVAWTGNPEKSHKMNGWATPTVYADGQHVWAWFGPAGVYCYTEGGKPVWSQQLGKFDTKNARGISSSLLVVDDILVVNGDSESDPYLFGLDKATGKTVWKTERPAAEGYSSPFLLEAHGKKQIILNGDKFVAGYDPKTGKEFWHCKSFAGRGEPVPAVGADGTIFVVNGLAGDVYAVRTDGAGDVTKTHMTWHTRRNEGRDQPSPLVIGNHVLVSNMKGILSCYDAKTGKELWKERIATGDITAAPLAAGGKGYFNFENGETVVIEPGEKLKIVATNKLVPQGGEVFRASLAPADGKLLIRSDQTLYCIK
ncbi:PQQ-like beta-propeller repeat protein [Humisphaera borealis]|nr:PQQ-binding-like beta-propeller repeat protein [Humisphaera borealis]